MTSSEARGLLGLTSAVFTKEELTAAYRAKVRECHPDIHGKEKEAELRQVNLARDFLIDSCDGVFGIAGRETWSEIRGFSQEVRRATTSRPEDARAPEVADDRSLFGRLRKRATTVRAEA